MRRRDDSVAEWRRARAADADSVAELVDRAYSPWIPVIGRKPLPMTTDYHAAVRRRRIDLLLLRGRLVGLVETEAKGGVVIVHNVAVEPAFHGRGLGRLLLHRAEAAAGSRRARMLRLYTHHRYARNIRVYLQAGIASPGGPASGGASPCT